MIEPFTTEDVALVAHVLLEQGCPRPATEEACAILAALSSSGRLLPPGSEVREEFGVRWHGGQSWARSEREAREWLREPAVVAECEPATRRIITTPPAPWSPVPDTNQEG